MKLVLGQVAESEGKYTMRRAIELQADELKKLPAKQIKGILFHAYMQLLEIERDAEIAELNSLLAK